MKTVFFRRIPAALLCCLLLLSALPVFAAQSDGFSCKKTAERQDDGTVRITLEALQTGRVAPADVVLVLDVSASMEHNAVIPQDEIDGATDYYILYEYYYWNEDREVLRRVYVPVHNTAGTDETPTWFATLPDTETLTQIDPAVTPFYTGAMEALRTAVSSFVQSVAENAALYDADHRIAVVEFSARDAKGTEALCTHDNNKHIPFYANILSGDGTSSGALVSVQSGTEALQAVIDSLRGDGATYSDDAMTQAKSILSSSDRQNRVVVLFTDGGPGSYGWTDDLDSSALPTANGAIATASQMKAQGIQIFTVGALNESDFAGAAGEQNRKYLNYLSSNYPDAQSMTVSGEKAAERFCTIGRTNMDLQGVFSAISSVIGTPIHSAYVQDVLSSPFYLTDTQKTALLADYPAAEITENADGTTSIVLNNVDFPTVAVRADGAPVDPDDPGIFSMTFSVTPRESFIGGTNVATNTGACGVFADGVQLAQFDTPQVNVPIQPPALKGLLSLNPVTLHEGDCLTAESLYEDLSGSSAAQYVDSVAYAVTDEAGALFTSGTIDAPQTFAVSVFVTVGSETYTAAETVSVQVDPHCYTAEIVAPTCTEGGCTTYTCSVCGDSYVADKTAARGHAYTAVVTEPTCTAGGCTTHTCSRCGDSYVTDKTAARGHAYDAVKTEPTCTAGGCTTHTCSRCGDSYVTDKTAELGHEWDGGVVAKEPTEKAEGVRTYTCTRCGETRSEPIEKLPASALTLTESLHGNCGTSIRVTAPYGRKGAVAFRLTASESGVRYSCTNNKLLTVDQDGCVRFTHLRLLNRNVRITAKTADGKEAVCEVKVQIQWWHYLIWLLFGWIWF